MNLIKSDYKIYRTIVFSSNREDVIYSDKRGWGNIFFTRSELSCNTCGLVDPLYFSLDADHVSESHVFNTCLNRKVAIDRNGNIKNCLGFSKSFGNIHENNIVEVVADERFKEMWTITKDTINVCRDCEFRHICTDCRAFLENPDDVHSKPLKCGYNPYTNEWNDWKIMDEKQSAIKHFFG